MSPDTKGYSARTRYRALPVRASEKGKPNRKLAAIANARLKMCIHNCLQLTCFIKALVMRPFAPSVAVFYRQMTYGFREQRLFGAKVEFR